jgi:hypothetical protein
MRTKRRIAAAGIVGATAALMLAPVPAQAAHTHVMKLASGECVVLAEGAGEASVELPAAVFDSNPNVDVGQIEGREHPLHVLVHLGTAGDNVEIYVMGSAAAIAACGTDFVNP